MPTSPLMFESESDDDMEEDLADSSNKENAEESIVEPSKEERIVKGFQTVLMGIPPPPAFTVPQLDSREMLKQWRENQSFRVALSPEKCENNGATSKRLEKEAINTKWPDVLQLDYWDVYYNKNTTCEELERLSIRYKERYVGAETSSCINALFAKSPIRTASARKRARHRAWGHSPGRRLSHLARRRKAFSSANLCSVAGNNNPDKKMIMVEIKKIGNRKIGQKKKGSAKKSKPTPKKKNEPQSSTYKRALFQSPDQDPMNAASKTPNTQCVQRSKRNLFADSSDKKNEFGKRERPMPKRVSPRKRVNRSLSFQENSQPCIPPPAPIAQPQGLTGAHKQKMLWAATHALREEGMGMSHELFRPCMTVLFRTCQRLWLTRLHEDTTDQGSTSERMLALAKRFSSYTIREISSDPTSEHMALVYNNSLKMAESMINQVKNSEEPSMCNENVKRTSSDARNVSGYDRGKKKAGGHDVSTITESLPEAIEVTIENRPNTPNNNKKISNCLINNHQINSVNSTISAVSCKDSPRRTRKTCGSQVEVDEQISDSNAKPLGFSANVGSCENTTSPLGGKPQSCILNKEGNKSLRKTPTKNSVLVKKSPVRSCRKERLGELNRSSPMNKPSSSGETQRNTTTTESQNDQYVVSDTNDDNKLLYQSTHLFIDNSKDAVLTEEQSSTNRQTPSKKVSFCTQIPIKTCFVTIERHPIDLEAKCLSLPSVVNNGNNLSSSPNISHSILKKASIDTNFHVLESCGGRRVTRSVLSTDDKVKNNKPIHHLFSPPSVRVNNVSDNKSFSKTGSKQIGNHKLDTSEAQPTPNISVDEELRSPGRRLTRRSYSGLKTKKSPVIESSNDRRCETVGDKEVFKAKSDSVVANKPSDSELVTHYLRATKSPKKIIGRRISSDAKSTSSVNSSASISSSQSNIVENNDAGLSLPDFISPRTRLRKSKLNAQTNVEPSEIHSPNITTDRQAIPSEIISPVTGLRKATLNKRLSIVSSDASSSRGTPDKSVVSEEYSADTENSSGTLLCESETSSRGVLSFSEKGNGHDINKENFREGPSASEQSDKTFENTRHTRYTHLSSVENTPTNLVVPEEPLSRTLQLYRLSCSGGDSVEREKLLPEIVCLDPPKLMPHWDWAESGEELEGNVSPPSLTPHWEQESCSGTSTSLPESIMTHWQQLSTRANQDQDPTDKVMFDFEDTSYEITFPSANEDSRASSICAPFNYPLLIDDSKSGFNCLLTRSTTELNNQ